MKKYLTSLLTRLRERAGMNRTDHFLLSWAGLSFAVLVLLVVLTACGLMQ